MATNIEWTRGNDGSLGETWNPVVGCTRVSAGCDNCYAVGMTNRLDGMSRGGPNPGKGRTAQYRGLTVLNKRGERHFNGIVRTVPEALDLPLRWKKPRRIFVNSMSDLFHKDVPFEFIDQVFAVMALCPQHTFQVLTKRPEGMEQHLSSRSGIIADRIIAVRRESGDRNPVVPLPHIRPGREWWPLANVWLGTSCENQNAADARIPHLLRCPAAVRFISAEPLLGAVDFLRVRVGESLAPHNPEHRIDCLRLGYWSVGWGYTSHSDLIEDCGRHGIDWVIVGGESGPGARPCDVAWIRSIVAQCKAAGVPVFVKQLGGNPSATLAETGTDESDNDNIERMELRDKKGGNPSEWPADLRVREFPEVSR